MKKISVLLAAPLAAAAGDALAFDDSDKASVQVYFAIPLGAPSKQEATPWLGFRVDRDGMFTNDDRFVDDGATLTSLPAVLDLRFDLGGQTSLQLNGVDLEQRIQALYAAEGEGGLPAYVIPLAFAGAIAITVIAVTVADDDDDDDQTAGGCFTADTRVVMADGERKRIAEVALGEKVMSYDFATNRRVASAVTRLFRLRARSHLRLNGLQVTGTHPFAVGEDEWREAGKLRVGDRLMGNGDTEVEELERVDRAADVFNMTVDGTHNYYVGDAPGKELLVHNKAIPPFGCFIEGSRVLMADGSARNIANVGIGDAVQAWDRTTRRWGTYPVTDRQNNPGAKGYYVINDTMRVSPWHLLYCNDQAMRPGDIAAGAYMYDARLDRVEVKDARFVDAKADRHNIVLGRNRNLMYAVDGRLVCNCW